MYDAPLENPEHAMYDDMVREIEALQQQVEDLKDSKWPFEWQVATEERAARKRAEERYKKQHATISELRANEARLGMDREKARNRIKELEDEVSGYDQLADALWERLAEMWEIAKRHTPRFKSDFVAIDIVGEMLDETRIASEKLMAKPLCFLCKENEPERNGMCSACSVKLLKGGLGL